MLSRNKDSEGVRTVEIFSGIAIERTRLEPYGRGIPQNRENCSQKSGGFGIVSRIAD